MFSFNNVLLLPTHNRASMLFICYEIQMTISDTEYCRIHSLVELSSNVVIQKSYSVNQIKPITYGKIRALFR